MLLKQMDNSCMNELNQSINEKQNKYVIIMATYNRINNKTPFYLERSLNSILNQTNNNWDLIIVGDKYEPINILIDIVENIKKKIIENSLNNKVILMHNHIVERDYIKDKLKLWRCAGANSINMGLKYARNAGYKYYLHLDDDDYWYANHIEEIDNMYKKFCNCIFVNTQSKFIDGIIPKSKIKIFENNLMPKGSSMAHSSFSFRLDIISYNYITSFNENEIIYTSDAFMLDCINKFLLHNKKYYSVFNPVLTCVHDEEGESLK